MRHPRPEGLGSASSSIDDDSSFGTVDSQDVPVGASQRRAGEHRADAGHVTRADQARRASPATAAGPRPSARSRRPSSRCSAGDGRHRRRSPSRRAPRRAPTRPSILPLPETPITMMCALPGGCHGSVGGQWAVPVRNVSRMNERGRWPDSDRFCRNRCSAVHVHARSRYWQEQWQFAASRRADHAGGGTSVGSGSPRTPATRFAAAIAAILPRVARDAEAMCGTIRQLSSADQRVVHRDRLRIGDVESRRPDDVRPAAPPPGPPGPRPGPARYSRAPPSASSIAASRR